jgi:hypothetical protein
MNKAETFLDMNYKEWKAKYKPIQNGENGFWFDDPEQLKTFDPKQIWTWVSEGDSDWIYNGYRWINRLSYLVTEVAWQEGEDICVVVRETN